MFDWSLYPNGKVFQLADGQEVIGFFSLHTFLTNHHMTSIEFDGHYFPSSEHVYFYLRALFFEDKPMAIMFKDCKDGRAVKELARERRIRGFNEVFWHRVRLEKMATALVVKFTQNKYLADALRKTAPMELVEMSSTDKFWGCALGPEEVQKTGKLGNGENMLGKLLMALRGMILDSAVWEGMTLASGAFAIKEDVEYEGMHLVHRMKSTVASSQPMSHRH